MSYLDTLPNLFLDRSLGKKQVPGLLREAGLRLVTLAERYPDRDALVTDKEWLEEAGRRGDVVLMKDTRIRYNRAELLAVQRFGVRTFCLSRADLPAAAMGAWFLVNMDRIAQACRKPGPFMYIVYEKTIRRLNLPKVGQ